MASVGGESISLVPVLFAMTIHVGRKKGTGRTLDQEALFKRSGRFYTYNPLISFLYELMRDHVPTGVVENVLKHSMETPCSMTNGWLGMYADDVAARLRKKDGERQ